MDDFRESLLLLVSVPICSAIIGAELFYSSINHRGLCSTKGVLAKIYPTSLNTGLDALVRGVCLFVLGYCYRSRIAEPSDSRHQTGPSR